ncbi:MAG: tetratricopeptide repeat protein [Gemmatimonadaceae bacterium]|nr:tetratricopeptide repeat protein [Gemmatimonadaceae bacterium]
MATSARLDELKKKFDENPRRYFAPLANEYRKLGDLTQAIALCRTHLPNQPGHISGHIVLAQALYEARELGEARSIFEAALDLDPENLIALRFLGDIAREQGEPGSARGWYERVLEADPRNDEIAQLLSELAQSAPFQATADVATVSALDSATDTVVPSYAEPESADSAVPTFLAAPSDFDGSTAEPGFDAPPPAEFQANAIIGAHDAHVSESPPDGLALAHSIPALAELHEESVAPLPDAPQASAFSDEAVGEVSPAPTEDLHEVLASHDDPFFGGTSSHSGLDMGDLEAVAEPTVDDWFSAPAGGSVHEVAAHADSDPAAFDDSFFPDLSAATPVASPLVPEPASLSFAPPAEVDVQAPTPPFVRAEEERGSIPTPAFLASIAADPTAHDHAPPAVPEAIPAAHFEGTASELTAEPAEVVDWHTAPTPIDSPAIAEQPVGESTSEASEVAEPAAVESSSEFADFNAWIAVADSESAPPAETAEAVTAEAVTAEEEASAEVVVSEGAFAPDPEADAEPEPVQALGSTTEFETEDDYPALASEVASAATPSDFILEDNAFVPPSPSEVTYIASSISAPLEEVDAYSAGAPEMSAHEPFPIEGERERELEPFEPALAGWGTSPLDAAASMERPEEHEEFVVPVEGLVSRETLADLAAIAAASEAYEAAEAVEPSSVIEASAHAVDEAAAVTGEAEATPAVAAGESPAFVTETMAELYLQQGFHGEALSIYRQLLAQQPNDLALRDRVAALERGASSAVVEGLAPRDIVDRHGQSVRSFFLHFARREPRHSAATSGEDNGESSDPFGVTESSGSRTPSFSGVATREEALTVPDAPATAPHEAPTLSELFSAGTVSGADDKAASALASAFGSGEGGGVSAPSESSERELSLEHLFRDVPERSSGAVTLDEFYEGSSPGSSASPSPDGEGGEERDADIEQFTAWLEGLKKK